MYVIKFQEKEMGTIYLNVDDISYYSFIEDKTYIVTKTTRFTINGNMIEKLNRYIKSATNGNILTLE